MNMFFLFANCVVWLAQLKPIWVGPKKWAGPKKIVWALNSSQKIGLGQKIYAGLA